MNTKKILLGLMVLGFLVGGGTQAATGMNADELRAEIARLSRVAESIRSQLLKFGDDPSTVRPGSTDPSITVPGGYGGTACLQSNRHMKRGDSGGSVSTLQQFMVQQGVYSASLVTGYFGPATEAGVQQWQAQHGIVSSGTPATTGYGKVGPSTLRAMHLGCSGGVYTGPSGSLTGGTSGSGGTVPAVPKGISVERYSLSLNPTRGLAPMSVTAEFSITGSTCTSYMLDWGDGSLPVSYNSNRSTNCTPLPIKIIRTHIYNTAGTHTVRFRNGKAPITKIKEVSDLKVEVIGSPASY